MIEQLATHTNRIYDGTNPCTSITVHETANTDLGADAQRHADLQSNGTVRQASWHIQVDDHEAIRSYPDTAQCWHAGNDEGNRTSIAIEICVNADGDYDKAFRLAAEVVAELRAKHGLGREDVVQHNHWSGKDCPDRMRAAGRWDEFLALTDPPTGEPVGDVEPVKTPEKTPQEGPTMISPFDGRLTQNHGDAGGYKGHRGLDIAPPKPGQTGKPIYAAFAGWVVKTVSWAVHGNSASTWAPQRTGNGMLIRNPDGEGNGYNHMTPVASLNPGDWVRMGQLIGYNDRSGNQTAPHLHFELWSDWRNPKSDYDPMLAFRKHGIKPGSAPVLDVEPASSVKPTPKPKPKPGKTGKDAAAHRNYKPGEVKAIQEALDYAGYDVGPADDDYGDRTEDAVADYQDAQQFPRGNRALKPDGDWGPATQAHYEWTRRLQNTLNKWAAVQPKVRLDGDFRSQTTRAVRDVQDGSNGDGKAQAAYRKAGGRKVDGQPGAVTCRMLSMPEHP